VFGAFGRIHPRTFTKVSDNCVSPTLLIMCMSSIPWRVVVAEHGPDDSLHGAMIRLHPLIQVFALAISILVSVSSWSSWVWFCSLSSNLY
jgi:hypothetical protein